MICMLILFPEILLNLFISSNSLLVESLEFFMYKIMSCTRKDNFTSPFFTQLPFISFACLIALAITSSLMLNRSGVSGHTCLVTGLKGKVFTPSPLSMRLAIGLSYTAFSMLEYICFTPNLLHFLYCYHERMLNFVKCFFCIY